MRKLALFFLPIPLSLPAAERTVDPTWLHRYVPNISERRVDLTTPTCHYKPIFGFGDRQANALVSVARSGDVTVDPEGQCETVSYPREEQIYGILGGTPSIVVLTEDNPSGVLDRPHRREAMPRHHRSGLQIVYMTLRPGEEIIVGRRLREPLASARRSASSAST